MNCEDMTRKEWWKSKRGQYNYCLIGAGVIAFILYAFVLTAFSEKFPEASITLFTIIFQGVAYFIAMGVANICYGLGAISESIIKPKNVLRFRKVIYNLGLIFSVSLPSP